MTVTNKEWYAYPLFGSYFKLEHGELLRCGMNANGSRDENPAVVDIGFAVSRKERLKFDTIRRELETKE